MMMPNSKDILRIASLLAALAAGSCSALYNSNDGLMEDPVVNHPIQVEPSYRSLKLNFSAPNAGLMPDDSQHFDEFVADFIAHGNGAISITVPSGRDSSTAISYFGERMAAAGVPRDRILVGTRETAGNDGRVELGYISYQASTAPCGDWSASVTNTAANHVMANFGCAVQHNIAAQVADPRDLMAPQPPASADAARRAVVYDNYRNGKPTGATLSPDQSGAVSDVSK
jgi:pilus assembly protein CpaD